MIKLLLSPLITLHDIYRVWVLAFEVKSSQADFCFCMRLKGIEETSNPTF
jgi:hypothetical protein